MEACATIITEATKPFSKTFHWLRFDDVPARIG
jgi:hypothetical protein